jgi:putative ATP-binding cassette transporter
MTLLQILRVEAAGEVRRLVLAANMAGISSALLLATINEAAHSPESADVRGLMIFSLLVALYAICARHVDHRMNVLIEAALHRIKLRVGDAVVRAELDALERVGAAEICDRITNNLTLISDRAGLLATLLQSGMVIVFIALYIAWLSPAAFGLVALVIGISLGLFMSLRREFVAHVATGMKIRVRLFEHLTDLVSGFKQIRFGRQRSADLRADFAASSDTLRRSGTEASEALVDNMVLGEVVFFALLGTIVYALHLYVPTGRETIISLVAAATFLWGPFLAVAMGIMPYIRANVALAEVDALEHRLTAILNGEVEREPTDPWRASPASLELHAIEYHYTPVHSEACFHIGPLDLRLRAGEIVFIVGGNGSGKSTLLKVLTGLYPPGAGTIALDGVDVAPYTVVAYRERISAIFGDFHLFDRLHGLEDASDAAVHRLLGQMQLAGKTDFVDRTFTMLALSTGQRKRLAMLVCLLEDRPIVVFDEWAADQDPEFRRYFYDALLPWLRDAGKLVLAVSHDDRYFDRADRVVVMEYGQIREIRGGRS